MMGPQLLPELVAAEYIDVAGGAAAATMTGNRGAVSLNSQTVMTYWVQEMLAHLMLPQQPLHSWKLKLSTSWLLMRQP